MMMKRKTDEILCQLLHRPYALPAGPWSYYQEWNNALFLHWKVPAADLNRLLPAPLQADVFEGDAWISLVPFTMQKIRPRNLPAVKVLSDFHEINLRTYVTRDNKPGVYFLNIGAEKRLAAQLARLLSGLPYEKADMRRQTTGDQHYYRSGHRDFLLEASFSTGDVITEKTGLDKWLTERYCLYLDKGAELYRYEIHHKEWPLRQVTLLELHTGYTAGSISIERPPDLAHYSEGVQVIAWKKERSG